MSASKNTIVQDLLWLLGCAGFLYLLGTLFIYSASALYAFERSGTSSFFLTRHLVALIVGFFSFATFSFLPTQIWRKHAPLFFGLSLIVTALTLIPSLAVTVQGSARWLRLRGLHVLPSEVLKLFFCMYLGFFFTKCSQEAWKFTRTYLPLVVLTGVVGAILCHQPDYATALVMALTMIVVSFSVEGRVRHMLILLTSLFLTVGGMAWIRREALKQLFAFSAPWRTATMATYAGSPSLLAIGSGNWWGAGVAYSRQSMMHIPLHYSNYIFAVVAQQVGFIGGLLVIATYVLFAAFGLRVSLQLKDPFAAYTTLGCVALITLQSFLSMLITTDLLSMQGLPLPFLSFGASGVVVTCCMLGVITNFVLTQRASEQTQESIPMNNFSAFSLHDEV